MKIVPPFHFHYEAKFWSRRCGLLIITGFLCLNTWGQAREATSGVRGFIDFNAYYDTREFSVLTFNILANLPNRFQYFSLTNYQSSNRSSDLNTMYAEHNLRWGVKGDLPIDLTFQYVIRDGEDNDDYRLGIRWRVNQTNFFKGLLDRLNMSYSINPMFVQFRRNEIVKYITLIEHVYLIKIAPNKWKNRLYLGGFADQNFITSESGDIAIKWVTEHQLGFRIIDQLHVVLEYRINDYNALDTSGLGYGLEYKMLF